LNFLHLLLMGGVVLLMMRLGKSNSDSPLFINPGLQKIVLMKDPLYFVTVLATTWRQQWQSILVEMVGVFGWRNVQMTDSLAVYVFLVIVWLVIKRLMIDLKDKIKPVQALVSLAVLALVGVLICLAMYVVATVVGDRTINGVQGRYLLPLLPIGLIMVAVLVDWSKERELIKWLFFGLVLGGVLGSIGHSLWLRYYDFSMDWVNGPIDEQDLEMIEDGDFEVLEINKKVEVVAEAGGKSISGVVLKMRNNNRAVLIPYRYRIKDAKCEKTFRFGYLSVWGIQADNEYILSFKRVKADQNKLCLELEPIELDIKDYDNFLTMEAIDKQMKIEWLYF